MVAVSIHFRKGQNRRSELLNWISGHRSVNHNNVAHAMILFDLFDSGVIQYTSRKIFDSYFRVTSYPANGDVDDASQ